MASLVSLSFDHKLAISINNQGRLRQYRERLFSSLYSVYFIKLAIDSIVWLGYKQATLLAVHCNPPPQSQQLPIPKLLLLYVHGIRGPAYIMCGVKLYFTPPSWSIISSLESSDYFRLLLATHTSSVSKSSV